AAGALIGIAATMRLDAIFALAPVLVIHALTPRQRSVLALAESAMTLLGLTPGLALLAATNRAKFGSWQPLSYGPWHESGSNTGLATYLPLAILGTMTVLAVHAVAPRIGRIQRRHVWM